MRIPSSGIYSISLIPIYPTSYVVSTSYHIKNNLQSVTLCIDAVVLTRHAKGVVSGVQVASLVGFYLSSRTISTTNQSYLYPQALLTADFEIGHYIRERVVSRAVLLYTGEGLDDDDDDDYEEEVSTHPAWPHTGLLRKHDARHGHIFVRKTGKHK